MYQGIFIQCPRITYNYCKSRQLLNFTRLFLFWIVTQGEQGVTWKNLFTPNWRRWNMFYVGYTCTFPTSPPPLPCPWTITIEQSALKIWCYNNFINTSDVHIKQRHCKLLCLHHDDYSSPEKVDILQLCCSKIAWDNYARLQMISAEYFPAFGRSLNCVKIFLKKREFFCGIETCQNRAARWSWIWIVVDPGNEFAITHDAMPWNARVIWKVERSSWSYFTSHFTELNNVWKQ